MPQQSQILLSFIVFATVVHPVLGDPNDWLNTEYIIQRSHQASVISSYPQTNAAQDTIVSSADSISNRGALSVMNSKGVLPPSNDGHDYLSWAPYHWPNCNWCRSNEEHIASIDAASPLSDFLGSIPKSGESHEIEQGFRARRSPRSFSSTTFATAFREKACSERNVQSTSTTLKRPCKPSPTSSMAPSATWTACPYVSRDGQVNPDVQTLHGPGAMNTVCQLAFYNSIAFSLKNASVYSKSFGQLIETFFVAPATKVNPNVNFGQIVRGPGREGSTGTFTGVLDFRGLVKVVNAILGMRGMSAPEWTYSRDRAMIDWMGEYISWLETSPIALKTGTRANNHVSFFVSQVAAAKMLVGDYASARLILRNFFAGPFMNQLAASGEQPFEAVRTRPYHYRCFNLEALITNAKIGDQLDMNFWSTESRYGATIQKAVDFVMSLDPKHEDAKELVPHIASVAAAYGDPVGKYASFMKKIQPEYQSKPFWFYDQTAALVTSPAAKGAYGHKREQSPKPAVHIKFECFPTDGEGYELDDGVFVTCDDLEPYYNLEVPGAVTKKEIGANI